MKYSAKKLEKTCVRSILFGLTVSLISVVLGSMLLSTLIISGTVIENRLEIGIIVIHFISTVIGSLCIRLGKGEGRRGAVLLFFVSTVILLLLVNVVLFDARYQRVLLKIGTLAVGTLVGQLRMKDGTKKYSYG